MIINFRHQQARDKRYLLMFLFVVNLSSECVRKEGNVMRVVDMNIKKFTDEIFLFPIIKKVFLYPYLRRKTLIYHFQPSVVN